MRWEITIENLAPFSLGTPGRRAGDEGAIWSTSEGSELFNGDKVEESHVIFRTSPASSLPSHNLESNKKHNTSVRSLFYTSHVDKQSAEVGFFVVLEANDMLPSS